MNQADESSGSEFSAVIAEIQSPSNRKFIYVTLFVLLITRLCFQFCAAPLPDEAYYWLWGIHLGLSYYDHPPLQAWLQGIDARIFGWNLVSLRLLTLPTTVGLIAILLWWSRRLAGPVWSAYFLATTAIFFASPLIFIFTTMVFNDHLLIFLSYLSASFFVAFFMKFADRGQQPLLPLYLGAVTLGLAALTKYNAIFLGLGLAVSVIASPTLRPLLRSPHIYLAAALTSLLQLPVLYWNAANGFSSFEYHLWERLQQQSWTTDLTTLVAVLLTSVVLLSPFLIAPVIDFLKSRPKQLPWAVWQTVGCWTFVCSTLSFFVLCFFVYVHYYWNIEAYLIFFPLALVYFKSAKLLRAHIGYGIICAIAFTFNYTILPLSAIAGQADFESARVFGWDEIGRRVAKAKVDYDAKFVVASDWQSASQLAFALQDPTVECFEDKKSQFSFWLNKEQRKGQDAIILVDEPQSRSLNSVIRPKFRSVELIATIPITRLGKILTTYQVYRGTSYLAEAP